MRNFIDIINQNQFSDSNRIEIIFSESAYCLLDSYQNPKDELEVQYSVTHKYPLDDKLYMEATVFEKSTHHKIIRIDYRLGDKNLVISNVISFRNDKNMYTSNGPQDGAADLGHIAMMWLFRNILSDAKDRGYDNTRITSSTRYSGARAKNGKQTSIYDEPMNYDVAQKIKERFVYSLKDGLRFLI
jgi:hypothetical protein